MVADVLSTMLKSVRIAGSLQFCLMTSGRWQTDGVPRLARLARTSVPTIPFHVVATGQCWLAVSGRRVELAEGDVVAFPFATGHALGVGDDGPIVRPIEDLPPRPWRDIPVLRYGEGGITTRMLCGYITLDAMNFGPLRDALPDLIHLQSGAPGASPLLRSAVQQMVAEADGKNAGGTSVLERLTELILIELLRSEIVSKKGATNGLLAGMSDPVVARCLGVIHQAPGEDWTVASLAQASATSRSVLAEKFQAVLGSSPMRYVREWRLFLASNALGGSHKPISRIAEEAGYDTEAAFSRAFSRLHGMPPARWRALARQRGSA